MNLSLRPIDPALKMFDLYLVTVNERAAVVQIAGVEVHSVIAGNQRQGLFKISAKFVNGARLACIVPGSLNTPGKFGTACPLESTNVIPLPTVHRNRNRRKFFQSRIDVHTNRSVAIFR